jgi:asparagine synthase (glutamine-hydrolysing)
MCGLSALFAPRGGELGPPILAMTDMVHHRGPDDEGYAFFVDGRSPLAVDAREPPAGRWQAALGHRRLSIVDLTPGGHQPMCLADGDEWIIYNGEIYNHFELRAELEREGVRFTTRSDTEVMLAAYRRWGEECLAWFNGMFAFILVDWPRRRVFAARDRFGVKPLYYRVSPDGWVAFASEIKQFTVLPGWRAVLNGQRAYDFLNWGLFDHTAETLFQGVRQLRGGECISASLDELPGGLQPRRWYRLGPRVLNGAVPAEAYRDALEDSVRLRLRADVPVGSCLSGGLDSSSIVCLANRQLRAAGAEAVQRTFSARSTDLAVDEGRFIDAVVRHTGVSNVQVQTPAQTLFADLPKLTWHQDEPFGSTSVYAQWHVFRLAAENGVKVMLDGQGADEQLGGYEPFFAARVASLARHGRLATLMKELPALPTTQLGSAAALLLPERARQALRRAFRRPSTAEADWLDRERLGAHVRDPFLDAGGRPADVQQLSMAQLLYTSLPMLLHWEDRDSMAHSVEARVPFLDYRLVELSLGLPEDEKIAGGVTKRVLREAMSGILPEPVRARRDKIGFATAEQQWLRRERPDDFSAAMRDAVEASQGVLRPAALALLDEVIAGRRPFSFLPWRMISFGAWMRRFDVRLA